MKISILLVAPAALGAAVPIAGRANGEANLLGGFDILGAGGQEGFAGFAGFLDNFFNGVILSPIAKALQGKPIDAVGDAIQGAVGTAVNAGKSIGNVGNGIVNGYKPKNGSPGVNGNQAGPTPGSQ